jgi:hypothetical protein
MTTIRFAIVALSLIAMAAPHLNSASREPCYPSRPGSACCLDVGEVKKGEIIHLWARIANIGDSDTILTANCQFQIPVKAGQEVEAELCSLNTFNYSGPITRTISCRCDPPALLQITLYKSHEELLSDVQ